jgi:hypothetical protein
MFKIACVILVATLSLKGDYLASELAEEEEAKLPPFVRKMLAASRLKLTDTLDTEYEATFSSNVPILMVTTPILATNFPILASRGHLLNTTTPRVSTLDPFDDLIASYVSQTTSDATLTTPVSMGATYSEIPTATRPDTRMFSFDRYHLYSGIVEFCDFVATPPGVAMATLLFSGKIYIFLLKSQPTLTTAGRSGASYDFV